MQSAKTIANASRARTRKDNSRAAADLRSQGMLQGEIAERLGLSRSYVSALLSDTDGVKDRARKQSYQQPCPSCGEMMNGSNGPRGAPSLCASCAAKKQHDDRYWTRKRIIEAFIVFRERTGRTMAAVDAQVRSGAPSLEAHLSTARLAEIESLPADLVTPNPWTVQREFGSWNAGLVAAGLHPNKSGATMHRVRKGTTMKLFVVLSQNGAGWVPSEPVEATNGDLAIQQVADGEGSYVAVPAQHWTEKKVAPQTVFAVVKP